MQYAQNGLIIHLTNGLKLVSLIYFMVSEINILTQFRKAICNTFIINCKSFKKIQFFSINTQ